MPFALCKLLPWGKLFLEISGELGTLAWDHVKILAGATGAVGQGVPLYQDVLCCLWGLAPAWGLFDPCSSEFKIFPLLISFANGGLAGRMQLGAGAWAWPLGGDSPTRREGTERAMQIVVRERGKTRRRPFS